jgi:long-chain acyl-CoA synthetase
MPTPATPVQEAAGAQPVPLDPNTNLLEPVWRHAAQTPDRPLLAYRGRDRFVDITAGQLAETVRGVAAGFMALGIKPGDRVALMSGTRFEWTFLDYAIQAAGGVTVPIYETSSAEQMEWIVGDSGAVAILLENAEMEALFKEVADRLPACRHSFVIERGALEELASLGASIAPAAVQARADAVSTGALATIIYTSGTTGRPKGCMLTHGNLRWDALQTSAALDAVFHEGDSTLLFLPLAHSFAKIVALVLLERGLKIGYATDVEHVPEELAILQPTFVVAVPRVFERMFNKAQHKAAKEGKGRIFHAAARAATDFSRQRAAGSIAAGTRLRHWLFDHLVYGRIRAAFGGRLRYAVSGGAPLGERLGHFFDGVGVTILEGYGLTETSPVITVNTPEMLRIGTVGRPIPGTTVGIAEDGEVLCRGGQVFQGYWHNEAATREMIDAKGWLQTGDLGDLDEAGRLRITGRKRDIIVTAGGKNVAPATLEDRLRGHPLISDSMVVGDGRPFIAALIALDAEALAEWATERGKAGRTPEELRDDPDVRAVIDHAVAEANAAVSRAEAIRRFTVLPRDLAVQAGELTPTMKVRRDVVASEYADEIDLLYRQTG